MDLVRTLARLALVEPGRGVADEDTRHALRQATCACAWERTLRTLELHRLWPTAGEALAAHGLLDAVPGTARTVLTDAYRRTGLTNTVLLHTLARVLTALRARGVEPVVWKGAVLADSFYREPGARWMGDVDLSIDADEVDATAEAFAEAGLRRPEWMQTEDAVYFEHPTGIIFDVHHRVRLFEPHDPAGLTIELTPRHLPSPSMTVLAPAAMLVHLIVHLDGHRHETGYLMSWLLDIGLVLQQWGDRITPERVHELMPEGEHTHTLHRVAGFLQRELGVDLPAFLTDAAEGAAPLTLAEVLRRRRLAQWELPAIRGWARLGACLGGKPRDGRPWPTVSDLVCWPGDRMKERRGAA